MARRVPDNSDALNAFLAAKAEIDTMLARLTALSAEHFGINPNEINWGHVGTLTNDRNRLREIIDRTFRESEHAE